MYIISCLTYKWRFLTISCIIWWEKSFKDGDAPLDYILMYFMYYYIIIKVELVRESDILYAMKWFFLYILQHTSMSGSRTTHQLYQFQRYPRIFPMVPWNVPKISNFLGVGVLSIRVGEKTRWEPPCGSVSGGTVTAAPSVIILVRCGELTVIAVRQAIT